MKIILSYRDQSKELEIPEGSTCQFLLDRPDIPISVGAHHAIELHIGGMAQPPSVVLRDGMAVEIMDRLCIYACDTDGNPLPETLEI